MTAKNATPATALTLDDALSKARRLNYLLGSLDVVAANLDGNLPKTKCITTLNAHNSIQPLIETINEKARELVEYMDRLSAVDSARADTVRPERA